MTGLKKKKLKTTILNTCGRDSKNVSPFSSPQEVQEPPLTLIEFILCARQYYFLYIVLILTMLL